MDAVLLSAGIAPILTAVLSAAAVMSIWLALAPAKTGKTVTNRLGGYLDRSDVLDGADMDQPFTKRALSPFIHRLLSFLGGLLPQRDFEKLTLQLSRAGDPGGMTALDFVGLRLLVAIGASTAVFFIMGLNDGLYVLVRNIAIAFLIAFMLPKLWLNSKIKSRRTQIARALPDALDMLTIGVEAGLAFESALLRVGDQWNNALSQEFRRVVSEMRVGVGRNDALRHLAERTAVEDLSTFVAVLIQSNMLGVSISQVLHTQADQMRLKRRQHAEEEAHAATVKIVVVLVFFLLPSLFIVILGPSIPRIMSILTLAGGGK
jgi:tight adherence protein C